MNSNQSSNRLTIGFSGFLDFLRIASALTVFLAHLSSDRFGGQAIRVIEPFAHDAVIVFFLLSGYLISYSAVRDGKPGKYALNRIARIYTVAIPALLLTYMIDSVLIAHFPGQVRSGYQIRQVWKYLPMFLTFSTDFWFLGETAFSNAPYWSLCYECWYYVVFGIAFFSRGWMRTIGVGLVLLLMGPKLWILFPIWLGGAAIRYAHVRGFLAQEAARTLFAAAILLLIALKASGADIYANDIFNSALNGFPKDHLRYSQYVPGDYAFAVLVGTIILASNSFQLTLFAALQRIFYRLASVSFSLYLTHFPLLILFGAIWPKQWLLIGGATLASSTLFALVIETRTGDVKRVLQRIVAKIAIGGRSEAVNASETDGVL